MRARIAYEDCNGECRLRYEGLNNRKFIRWFCGIPDNDPIPRGYVVATFIHCEEYPSVMLGVWDRENDQDVCFSADLNLIAAAMEQTSETRGKGEFLYGSEDLPIFASARARYGPLPNRLELDEICWLNYRTRSLNGALDPDVVIVEGEFRAGSPIALYGED